MADTIQDIILDALQEITVVGNDRIAQANDLSIGLRTANRLLDAWAARKVFAWNVSFTQYTLTPNHQPHLMGPNVVSPPDFVVAQRPVRIENAALVLTNVTPNVDVPLNLRDDDWWANQRVKGIATSVPTDLYYSTNWENGEVWLWPVPTFAYGLRLETWGLISQFVNLSDVFNFPPGYRDAIVLSLAEYLCRPFGKKMQEVPDLKSDAARARAVIQTNNAKSPRIASADYGTSNMGRRGDFNYYSGMPS